MPCCPSKQEELSENILQNLRNKWPPHPVVLSQVFPVRGSASSAFPNAYPVHEAEEGHGGHGRDGGEDLHDGEDRSDLEGTDAFGHAALHQSAHGHRLRMGRSISYNVANHAYFSGLGKLPLKVTKLQVTSYTPRNCKFPYILVKVTWIFKARGHAV